MMPKYTSNFGAALFGTTLWISPYSLGGMAEYFTSNGSGDWFIAPHAEGVGFELSRPGSIRISSHAFPPAMCI